jgi:hypothetical protein
MEHVSETLEALADAGVARAALKQHTCLRGIRGVPMAEVARIGDAVWRDDRPHLPDDADGLEQLFGAAWEDGLVAIGLLAACWADDPGNAIDQALDWATRIDDIVSADALGWFVLGPAAVVTKQVPELVSRLRQHPRDAVRRCGVMAAMAWTPATLEGPSAAALRAKVGQTKVRMVDASQSELLSSYLLPTLTDASPSVRKAQRRVLRAWANDDPEAVVAFGEKAAGALPKMLREEIRRAQRIVDRAEDELGDDLP